MTTVTHNRECLFGSVVDGEMSYSGLGRIARACWLGIPEHFPQVELDEFIVMPNHVDGILSIIETDSRVGARHAVPLQDCGTAERFGQPVGGSIPTIVRSFKSAVTRGINVLRGTPGSHVWQRGYYEQVITTDHAMNEMREYIIDNPCSWNYDPENRARPER